MGRQIIIYVLGSLVMFMIMASNTMIRSVNTSESSASHYSKIMARNTSNSICEMLISKVGDDSTYRANWTNIVMFDLSSRYIIIDSTIASASFIKIAVTTKYYMGMSKHTKEKDSIDYARVETLVKPFSSSPPFFPTATVKAAVTTNNSVETLGSMNVDGRDHDINGNVIASAGTYAVWTTSTYSRSGNSKVGSTSLGVDYLPAKVENNNVRLESQVYAGGYPNNPDDILGGSANGFPSGTLKAYAQSGANGSQYVTNPSALRANLTGVTYVELPSGSEWNPAVINGSGILIIHNSAVNAAVKNINSGTFKGLVIADDIIHLKNLIIGAVVGLSPSPSDGNCIGNGTGDILFSRAAILQATTNLKPPAVGYGFNKKRIEIKRWFE